MLVMIIKLIDIAVSFQFVPSYRPIWGRGRLSCKGGGANVRGYRKTTQELGYHRESASTVHFIVD